jgi:putative FmdB family regulatory protein
VPLYEYKCDACGRRFEVIQKFSDAPVDVCKECGKGPVHRLLSSPAIQFKGSGWYITDYAKKNTSDSAAATKTGGGTSETGDSTAKTDGAKADAPKSDSATTASKSKE